MFRVLTAFLLLSIIRPDASGQVIKQPAPVFKYGGLKPENSLLDHKITHPGWQSARFKDHYYVIVQMNHIPDPVRKSELVKRGIRLEQWISGNNWLAVCHQGFSNKNLGELGIKNIYAIPPSVKINDRLLEFAAHSKGPKDLIAVTCFPVD